MRHECILPFIVQLDFADRRINGANLRQVSLLNRAGTRMFKSRNTSRKELLIPPLRSCCVEEQLMRLAVQREGFVLLAHVAEDIAVQPTLERVEGTDEGDEARAKRIKALTAPADALRLRFLSSDEQLLLRGRMG